MILPRVAFSLTLALGILAAPLAAEAQQAGKVFRIGYLSPGWRDERGSLGPVGPLQTAFQQGLSELGYVEGKNVVIEYRGPEGKYGRLPELAAELVRLKVDVIFAAGQPALVAAKNATRTIPIVTPKAIDPVETGLVASLARPGGNITGLTVTVGPEIAGKWLQLLKEAVPKASRLAVLWNPTIPGYAASTYPVDSAWPDMLWWAVTGHQRRPGPGVRGAGGAGAGLEREGGAVRP